MTPQLGTKEALKNFKPSPDLRLGRAVTQSGVSRSGILTLPHQQKGTDTPGSTTPNGTQQLRIPRG